MKQRLPVVVFVALTGAFLVALTGVAQQPPPQAPQPPPVTFRVEVDYVEVDAFVTDAQGNPVTNLTADDFDVLEDGRPQKVTAFSLVNIPVVRAERPLFATAPVQVDVQTNEGAEGRIYLIVLDDAHTDPTRAPRVKAAARRFIEQNFGINDMAAVVFTGGRAQDAQDFTNNPRLLVAAIDKFTGRKFRSETLERLSNLRTGPNGELTAPDDPAGMERAYRARSVMSAIRQLAEFMAGVRGRRKAMLLIGEGIDYNIHDVMGQGGSTASSVLQDTQDAIAAATRGNVSIYAIDPRGLVTGAEDLIEVSSTLPEQGAGVQSAQSELRLSQDSLRVLAANTGGFAAVNQNDFNAAFDRIVAENSTYYLLGYYSTNNRRDGRYRKLEVRTKRAGLRVRSRTGYYEARGRRPASPPAGPTTNAAVSEALGSPLPVAGIPMKVFAAPFKGTAPDAAVALTIELDLTKLDLVEKGGTFTGRLDLLYTATSATGKVHPGERHTLNLALKPDTYERVKARGFRVLSQANLPPGRYQLRVAVGNTTGQVGSVLYDLDVPNFQKEPLSMSGVALTSAAAAEVTTVKPKDPLREFLPGPATTQREFTRGDTLAIFAEFYENLSNAQAHMIEMRAELRAEGGRVVREVSDKRSSTELQGSSGGYGFGGRISLDDVEPGLYVLHVEGQVRTGSLATVSRDIQIRVR
jgi:VWFA-related protein